VFVTGLGIISPLGLNVSSTWNSMKTGKSGISTITSFDPSNFETKIAGEIEDFDPLDYLDKKEARRTDRFVQLAVGATNQALLQASLNRSTLDSAETAVIIGSGIGGIQTLSRQYAVLSEKGPSRVSPFLIPMMLADMASAHISMITGAIGTNFCTISSCSSSADAIGLAAKLIRNNEAEVVIAGGSEAPICPIAVAGFGNMRALSRNNTEPQKASKPFDENRDGFIMSEGSAVLILESLNNVIKRGVEPIAELIGYASTSDAYHVTEPAPSGKSASRAIQKALEDADIGASQLDYINAHGTSTPLNDLQETIALKIALDKHASNIAISSTKSMTGHLLGASGALEAAISIMAMTDSVIPPTINLENPDPRCDLNYTPNISVSKPIRTIMSNSFGFGGHNSVLIFTHPKNL
jgi:3-oxoacyl-[acyl-carrier-protein] synthase II